MYPKCYKHTGPSKDLNIVKIAVQYQKYPAQLISFDQRQSLNEIIRKLCSYPDWDIKYSDSDITSTNIFALQFPDPIKYVTEENRYKVGNGDVLILTQSAEKVASDITEVLEKGFPDDKTVSLKKLCGEAKDLTFATEFIKLKGLDILVRFINTDKYTGDTLSYVLVSFAELMEHGIQSWKTIENSIIRRILRFIIQPNGPEIIQPALGILDSIVQNSKDPESIDIKYETLLQVLESSNSNESIQQNVIALINSLFQAASDERKSLIAHEFSTKKFRDVLISAVFKNNLGSELRYQLYVFQTLLLSLYAKQMMTVLDNNNVSVVKSKIDKLKQLAFLELVTSVKEAGSLKRPNKTQTKVQHKLGFKSESNIEESFKRTPPGLLPLDCLVYFAKNYSIIYRNIIAEINSTTVEYGFPLGEAAIELMTLLCDILRIGAPPCDQSETFYTIFFSHDHPLYELFCICIEDLNHTWKDMKATRNDFNKVFTVAKDQITRTLNGQPLTLNDFKRNIKKFTYSTISKLCEEERASREEYESTLSTIVELKEKLTPHILKIIKKQRLDYLVEGSRFNQYGKTGQRLKDKYWYARLSPNHNILHYGDWEMEIIPTVEDLKNQINVSDIKDLLVGKDCPIAKRKGQTVLKCLFAIVYLDQSLQPCEPLEFVALDELTQNYWIDGFNALLKRDMSSIRKNEDLDTLLSMEIKLRLLDINGIEIGMVAPSIPPDPEDYNF